MELIPLIGENIHHAYFIKGFVNDPALAVLNLFKNKKNIDLKEYENFFNIKLSSISIKDVRELESMQSEYGASREKVFCICANSIGKDAPNAMLKLLEEPKADTYFFIFLDAGAYINPTLLSRAHSINLSDEFEKKYKSFVDKFIKSSGSERIAQVAEIVAEHKDDEESSVFRTHTQILIRYLGSVLHKDFKKNNKILKRLDILHSYLLNPGSSPKMILEEIALML